MKTFQLIPALHNVDELQKIVGLIRECVDPVRIILIGRYADMQLASVLGGYELLIITRGLSPMNALEVQHYIDRRFAPDERKERRLFIYLLPYDFVAGRHHTNYFFHVVNIQGYMIYGDSGCSLWNRSGFKQTVALRAARQDMTRCLDLGNQFLQDAINHLERKQYRVTAFMIYQAIRQFFSAVILVNYGFEPREENGLVGGYSLVRHTSEALSNLWDLENSRSKAALNRIHAFNYAARFSHNFTYPSEKMAEHIEMLQLLAREAENVCKTRVGVLAGGISPK